LTNSKSILAKCKDLKELTNYQAGEMMLNPQLHHIEKATRPGTQGINNAHMNGHIPD